MKERKEKIAIKKYIVLKPSLSSYLTIFASILLIFNTIVSIYIIDCFKEQRYCIKEMDERVSELESSGLHAIEEEIIKKYYTEIDNKADEAINRILTILGILSTFITLFGFLLTFKAPKDIEKRLDELNELIKKADQAAAEATYQAQIVEALNVDYDGELTNSKRLKKLTEIIKKNPEKPSAYMNRGFLYDEMSKKASRRLAGEFINKAIVDYEMAKSLGADLSSYYNDMGVAYNRLKEYRKAIKFYSKAIEEDPDDAAAYSNRGSCYDDLHEYEKALADYEKALALDSEGDGILQNRSCTYRNLAQKTKETSEKIAFYKRAIQDLEDARNINPENEDCKAFLAKLQMELRDVYIALVGNEKNTKMKDEYQCEAVDNDERANELLEQMASEQNAAVEFHDLIRNVVGQVDATSLNKFIKDERGKHAFVAIADNGQKILFEKILAFQDAKTGKRYLVFTDNTKDADGQIKIYASIEERNDETQIWSLKPIETLEERRKVQQILTEIESDIKAGMDIELLKKYEENSIRKKISDKIFEEGYEQYIQGNFEAAEQRFLETYSMNKDYIGVRNNLAYMKRRGEGRKINISIDELLPENCEDGFSRINRAMCYIDGYEHEVNWNEALKIVCTGKKDYSDEKIWWQDERIVGKKESNIVLLLLLFNDLAQGKKVDIEEIEQRKKQARQDGYNFFA